MNQLRKALTLIVLLSLTASQIEAQQVLNFYDKYTSAQKTTVEVFIDSTNVRKYTNDPNNTNTVFYDGDIDFELEFKLNTPTATNWTFGRDVICIDNFDYNFEQPCAHLGCYIVPVGPWVLIDTHFVCPADFPAGPQQTDYRIKLGFSAIDLTKVGSVRLLYYVGTGSRDTSSGEFLFDNQYRGEVEFIVHVNGGNCVGPGNPSSIVNLSTHQLDMNVYPNPVVGNALNVNVDGLTGVNAYKIIDLTGQVIESGKSSTNNFAIELDQGISKGVYFINVTNNNSGRTGTKKILLD